MVMEFECIPETNQNPCDGKTSDQVNPNQFEKLVLSAKISGVPGNSLKYGKRRVENSLSIPISFTIIRRSRKEDLCKPRMLKCPVMDENSTVTHKFVLYSVTPYNVIYSMVYDNSQEILTIRMPT